MGSSADPVPVAIALGSNLGDRAHHLDEALRCLSTSVDGLRVSSRYDTAPVGVTVSQPRFLNAAAVGTTHLSARALLDNLLAIEASLGRTRPHFGAPRTVDLDLILYGDLVAETPHLSLPHPRFRERLFVLEPLAELVPEWRDPITGCSIVALLEELRRGPHPS